MMSFFYSEGAYHSKLDHYRRVLPGLTLNFEVVLLKLWEPLLYQTLRTEDDCYHVSQNLSNRIFSFRSRQQVSIYLSQERQIVFSGSQ
jgi:hypothetical protein